MIFTKHVDVSVKTFKETINGSLEMFEILIHETEVEIDRGDIWMVLSARYFQNIHSSVHVFECLAEVSTSVIVESQVGIAVSCLWVVIT